ncbi:calcium-binding protein [Salipiger abyssi]|uniref:Putative calcium-binding protein n=1 Tax=Salipiger abyssi TaxID=1250539 RepID=A0A1P8UWJ3_9RHOB|nr:calcium-binding protein [Salipiger abyssi]APZ53762.1 putative calcium-binding protein [Salipiger abyssi]
MTVYTLWGYRILESEDDTPIALRPASLAFVTTGERYFTYARSVDGDGNATFRISPYNLSAYLDGDAVTSPVFDYPTNEEIVRVLWNGGASEAFLYIEAAEQDDDNPLLDESFTYIFSFGPSPLPDFASVGAFNAFLDAAEAYPVNAGSGFAPGEQIRFDVLPAIVTPGNTIYGSDAADSLMGDANAVTFSGLAGADTLDGGDGTDTLIGGEGDDVLIGGTSEADLRDVVYGGADDDSIDGGYGNDELRGDSGNDTIIGGYGADTIIGGAGDDVLTGQAWSDAIFGGDGMDFINGGFGHDRVNGGAGADRFYHLGVEGHGSDWIQDFSDAEGDALVYGGSAGIGDFLVNFTETANAGAAGVEEAFVIYRPTGQILWALVDGAAQDHINLLIGGVSYDLLAL